MDGVGKTTISKYICEEFNFKYIEKPLHYFYNDSAEQNYSDLMKVANRMYNINDLFIKSWYFCLGDIYVSRMFTNQDIVIDRHLVSNYYWNGDYESENVFKTLIDISGVPDLTILLYAKPKTRMDRLKKRNKYDPDLNDPDQLDDGYAKMIYFIEKFNLPCVVIDTDDKSIEEVEEIVNKEIKELKGKTKEIEKKEKNIWKKN